MEENQITSIENNDEKIEETVVIKEETEITEEKPKDKKINVSIITIILAISTVVLALILFIDKPNTTISLNKVFPDVFTDNNASLKIPNSFMFCDDNGELFVKQGGFLKARGVIVGMEYGKDQFDEMKTSFVQQYGASEIEKEGYEVLTLNESDGTNNYTYYFIYKDEKMLQVLLLNCSEKEINEIFNGINF